MMTACLRRRPAQGWPCVHGAALRGMPEPQRAPAGMRVPSAEEARVRPEESNERALSPFMQYVHGRPKMCLASALRPRRCGTRSGHAQFAGAMAAWAQLDRGRQFTWELI